VKARSLADAFLVAALPRKALAPAELAALEAALGEGMRDGESAWPGVGVEGTAFAAHLGRLMGDAAEPAAQLRRRRLSDLYLAVACSTGGTAALVAFDRAYKGEIGRALRRFRGVEEIQQAVRERLFVSSGRAPPAILRYSGRGPLGAWVCAVALRQAVTFARKAKGEVALEEGRLLEIPDMDPELALIKAEHAQAFRRAVREAFATLTERDRNVLRLHLLDGLNIDQIGEAYDAHRATVARWIAHCRENIRKETRRRLAAELGVRGSRLDSLLRKLDSQLDASISKALRAG
jgi:RNA polymerase sigma-70 factor (ECF subfamily)